jgi:hypothetical protein
MEHKRKAQGTKRVTLLDTAAALNIVISHVKQWTTAIAVLDPCRERREPIPHLIEQN